MIIPVVFRKLRVQADTPLVVRVGIFVQNGVFWQTLLSAIGKGHVMRREPTAHLVV